MNIQKSIPVIVLACLLFSCGSEDDDMLPDGINGSKNGNEEENGNGICEEIMVTLTDNVLPIINQNCAISGCHVAGTGRVDLSVRGNIIQNANQIRDFTQSGFMPAAESGLSLNDEEKLAIYCWVEGGANDD